MEIRNYKQALDYLEGFIEKVVFKFDKEFLRKHDPLERMRIFLSLLGDPQGKFKSVLVGGTSGKGSTSYLISHILTTAGYKTGLTISPHLQKINERLQINGKEISDKEFVGMVASMIHIIEVMKKTKLGAPSYFEILIAMAFKYFADEKVDIAVVEVGMGGEFDGTNTLNPLVAVLTNVSLDHVNVLGNTVEKIAKTKAGIIKSDKRQATNDKNKLVVVTGVKQSSVIKIVEDKCKEVGAKLYRLNKDFKLTNFKISLLGDYQIENASLVIEAVKQLNNFSFEVSEKVIKYALQTAFFPGRFEIVNIARGPASTFPPASARSIFSLRSAGELCAVGSPSSRVAPRPSNSQLSTFSSQLILDGAHNPTKMRAFLTSLKKLFPKERRIFIIGFKFDKDISKMLKRIVKVADEIIVTEFHTKTDSKIHASANALDIKNQISSLRQGFGGQVKLKKVIAEKDSKKALEKALAIQQFNNRAIVVVTGSLYLVGEVRNLLL